MTTTMSVGRSATVDVNIIAVDAEETLKYVLTVAVLCLNVSFHSTDVINVASVVVVPDIKFDVVKSPECRTRCDTLLNSIIRSCVLVSAVIATIIYWRVN